MATLRVAVRRATCLAIPPRRPILRQTSSRFRFHPFGQIFPLVERRYMLKHNHRHVISCHLVCVAL